LRSHDERAYNKLIMPRPTIDDLFTVASQMHLVSASRKGHHKARVHGSRDHVHAVLIAQLDDKTFEHLP